MQGAWAASMRTTHHCTLNDFRVFIKNMWVTTGDVVEGQPDDLNWIEIYSSAEPVAWVSRQIDIDLEVGTYQAYKFTWHNGFTWVCECESQGYELTDTMDPNLSLDAYVTSINTPHGTYRVDGDNNFIVASEGEQVSPFEIRAGNITNVTWRFNAAGFDWDDVDDSGDYNVGDELNGFLADGIESNSMFDFLIEYE